MNQYVELVKEYPILSAIIQFAVLGTFGDIISKWLQQRVIFLPYKFSILFLKMLEWAFLGICIKYAFIGFQGFVESLILHKLLPNLGLFGSAFSVSVLMNLQFGLLLVILHRFLDNLISRENYWKYIDIGMLSLICFLISLHTITFMLDKPFQIGLAAVWSVILGIILGYYNREIKS